MKINFHFLFFCVTCRSKFFREWIPLIRDLELMEPSDYQK